MRPRGSTAAHSPVRRWAILLCVLIGTFAGTMGNSTSNVALPAVLTEFGSSLDTGIWVVNLYVLTFAVLMPVCGHLGDLYGHRRLYLSSMSLYAASSIIAALSPNMPWLLGARILQGISVAPILPIVMSIITHTFSAEERGRAMGFWALFNGAGHALGPALSGFVTQHLSWRAVFLVPPPLCLPSLLLAWRLLPKGGQQTGRQFDLAGAGMLIAATSGCMLALTGSSRWGWFSSRTLTLWGVALTAAVVFVVVERRQASPLVRLSLLGNREYAAAAAVIACQYFCMFGALLALPVFIIQGLHWDDQLAGVLILPLPLTLALFSPVAGRLADLKGSRLTCTLGMALVALAGLVLFSFVSSPTTEVAWWQIAGSLAVMGTGMGLTQSPVTSAVTLLVPTGQTGVATGLFHMGRFVSGILGTTVFGLVLAANQAGTQAGLGQALLLLVVVAGLAASIALRLPAAAAPRIHSP